MARDRLKKRQKTERQKIGRSIEVQQDRLTNVGVGRENRQYTERHMKNKKNRKLERQDVTLINGETERLKDTDKYVERQETDRHML